MMSARHRAKTTELASRRPNAAAEEEWPVALVPVDSASVAFVSFNISDCPNIMINKPLCSFIHLRSNGDPEQFLFLQHKLSNVLRRYWILPIANQQSFQQYLSITVFKKI